MIIEKLRAASIFINHQILTPNGQKSNLYRLDIFHFDMYLCRYTFYRSITIIEECPAASIRIHHQLFIRNGQKNRLPTGRHEYHHRDSGKVELDRTRWNE